MKDFFPFLYDGASIGWKPVAGFMVAVAFGAALREQCKGRKVLGNVYGAVDNAVSSIAKIVPAQTAKK